MCLWFCETMFLMKNLQKLDITVFRLSLVNYKGNINNMTTCSVNFLFLETNSRIAIFVSMINFFNYECIKTCCYFNNTLYWDASYQIQHFKTAKDTKFHINIWRCGRISLTQNVVDQTVFKNKHFLSLCRTLISNYHKIDRTQKISKNGVWFGSR